MLVWGAPVVIAHYLVVLWHVALPVKVQPGFPGLAIVLLLLINLLPVAGLFAFTKGFPSRREAWSFFPLPSLW